MSLPIVILPTQEKWDCHQCGICCRGSVVPLNPDDVERLRSQRWEEREEYQRIKVMVPHPSPKNRFRLAHRKDGSCVFLQEDGLCRIHSELGYEAKPTICRVFPLQLVPRGNDVALTIRRACPSSAADRGRPVQAHLPFVQQFAREGRLATDAIAPPCLKGNEVREWKTITPVFRAVADMLQDDRFPPVRRLVHALQFASLLEKAKTKAMPDGKLLELIQTLVQLVPEESKPFFQERRAPNLYARVLFYSMGIEYARLHPRFKSLPTWSNRVGLAKAAIPILRGTGPLPDLSPAFPVSRFEELERPLGRFAPSVEIPLSRMIEASSESNIYALADRRGWSVLDSIRGFVATFPVGLWLLRWSSLGREPSWEDMIDIVVALDRGQGFGALSGQLHRWRLKLLSGSGELERLVVWYAQ